MKSLSVAVVVFGLTCGSAAAQGEPTGTWRALTDQGSWEVVLRAEGSSLRGVVSSCASAPREIRDGRIEGNRITFSCRAPDRRRTIAFTGTVSGDEISFQWTMTNPSGVLPTGENFFPAAPSPFTASRVADSTLAAYADEVRGHEFASAVNLSERDAKVDGTLLIPASVRRVRAVIVATNWGLGTNFYNDPAVLRAAEASESALLLARFSDMSARRFRNVFAADGAAGLVALLNRLADESGHAELAQAPLLMWGHSAGGGGFIAEAIPERTIGLVLYHSSLDFLPEGPADVAGRARIPTLFIAGGGDTIAPPEFMNTMVRKGRAAGAPWTFAIEPEASHGSEEHRQRANAVVLPWIAAVLRLRLAGDDGPLRSVSDSVGSSGNTQTRAIEPTSASGRPEAIWLPDARTAQGWQLVSIGAK